MKSLKLTLVLLCLSPALAAVDIDQGEICLVCHDGLTEQIEATFPHAPAAAGECSACHNPHVSRFEHLLQDRPGPLCITCHTDMAQELDRAVVHQPVAEGRCVDCHTPHGGDNPKLLTRATADLCAGCHDDITVWKKLPVQHAPFARGDCSTCHEPHAADHDALSTRPIGESCTQCHKVDIAFKSAHQGYPVETEPCQQCHDPHASAQAGLFRKQLHPPFESGRCTACHALPGSDEPFSTRLPMDRLCGECHGEQVERSRNAPFPHVSAGGGDCQVCHNPHTADGSGLLNRPLQSLCLSCHDPGGSSSGWTGRFLSLIHI